MKIHFKKLTKKQTIITIIAAVLLIVIVPSAIYCGVYNETPAQMFHDLFTPNEEQLIGCWRGEKGVTGYEFKDDGTFSGYAASYLKYDAVYTADSSTITLTKPGEPGKVIYKYAVHADSLTLELYEENGVRPEQTEKFEYTRVKALHMQNIEDALKEYADSQVQD